MKIALMGGVKPQVKEIDFHRPNKVGRPFKDKAKYLQYPHQNKQQHPLVQPSQPEKKSVAPVYKPPQKIVNAFNPSQNRQYNPEPEQSSIRVELNEKALKSLPVVPIAEKIEKNYIDK
jgi:hypothetical protein